ncbi:MAG: SLATT domain-containing protein [Minicystis sp.]
MPNYKPEEKIYLTYKTRMTSERRLRNSAKITNLLLAWYSFSLIVFSLIDLSKILTISNFSVISAVGSIAIFGTSLYIYGEHYSERAENFRNCYLKLKALYESSLSTPEKMQRYADVLEIYENQTDEDYDEMMFDAFLRGQNLLNAEGPIRITTVKFLMVFCKRVVRYTSTSTIFLLPTLAWALWVDR